MDDLINHLRADLARKDAEIERLTAQLRAEVEHNRRLLLGYARAMSGLSAGLAVLRMVKADADDGNASSVTGIDAAIDDVLEDFMAADAIVLPLAGD